MTARLISRRPLPSNSQRFGISVLSSLMLILLVAIAACADGDDRPAGSGSLSIGDETFEVSDFGCVLTERLGFADPFVLSSFSNFNETGTEAPARVAAYIRDTSGEGRLEGDGVFHYVEFADGPVRWLSASDGFSDLDTAITIDGKDVHAEGFFDNAATSEVERVEGTLDLTCP